MQNTPDNGGYFVVVKLAGEFFNFTKYNSGYTLLQIFYPFALQG